MQSRWRRGSGAVFGSSHDSSDTGEALVKQARVNDRLLNSAVQHGYRPDIDGLRAIAVLLVVGFHAFPEAVRGGFIGVDIFFLISGFLISRIILLGLERKTFSLADFYARRIRRIFPALATVLIACMAFGWWVLFADEYGRLGKHTAAGAGFLSNFIFLREGGYFDIAAEAKPLLHLWSLSIEEQFYLIWPPLLVLLWGRKRWAFGIITFFCLLSFALNLDLTVSRPNAAFYLPQGRGWELGLGCILAYTTVVRQPVGRFGVYFDGISSRFPMTVITYIANPVSAAGAALIVVSAVILDNRSSFPGWVALMPTLGTFLLILSGSDSWVNRRLLSRKLLIGLGLISYPLYLWHWPILYFTRVVEGGEPSPLSMIALVLLSVILAWATFRYVEMPIRKRRAPWLSHPLVLCVVMVVPAFVGLMAYLKAIPIRFPSDWQMVAEARLDKNYAPLSWDTEKRLKPFHNRHEQSPEILFFGDSQMANYYPRIQMLIDRGQTSEKSVAFVTAGGCPPLPGIDRRDVSIPLGCSEFFTQTIDYIKRMRFRKIVLAASWDRYLLGGFDSHSDDPLLQRLGDYSRSPIRIGTKEMDGVFTSLETELRAAVARDTRIYIILPHPASNVFDPAHMLREFHRLGIRPQAPPQWPSIETHALETYLAPIQITFQRLSRNLGAVLIDPVPSICAEARCNAFRDGRPINADANHLSSYFVRNYASYIDEIFAREH